jgi:hypothetical protein
MSKQYRHRVGVRAEISFELLLATPIPSREELRDAVVAALNAATDEEGGFDIPSLADGRTLPCWASVDRHVNPNEALDSGDVVSHECTEVRRLQ